MCKLFFFKNSLAVFHYSMQISLETITLKNFIICIVVRKLVSGEDAGEIPPCGSALVKWFLKAFLGLILVNFDVL